MFNGTERTGRWGTFLWCGIKWYLPVRKIWRSFLWIASFWGCVSLHNVTNNLWKSVCHWLSIRKLQHECNYIVFEVSHVVYTCRWSSVYWPYGIALRQHYNSVTDNIRRARICLHKVGREFNKNDVEGHLPLYESLITLSSVRSLQESLSGHINTTALLVCIFFSNSQLYTSNRLAFHLVRKKKSVVQ